MTTSDIVIHDDEGEISYCVEIACPNCGKWHGFPEDTRKDAETTITLLQASPLCIFCLAAAAAIKKGTV